MILRFVNSMNLWGIWNENLKFVDNKKSKDYLKVINVIKLKEKETI